VRPFVVHERAYHHARGELVEGRASADGSFVFVENLFDTGLRLGPGHDGESETQNERRRYTCHDAPLDGIDRHRVAATAIKERQ